jgi:hypothetical protein
MPVFLNSRALASIIPSPRLVEKRIYRAAVWERLRTTGLLVCSKSELIHDVTTWSLLVYRYVWSAEMLIVAEIRAT